MISTSPLVLGPLLRFVGEHDASVWVETAGPARVTVAADGRAWHASSFVVEGHHYALVLLDDLEPPADLVDRDRGERRDEDEEVP